MASLQWALLVVMEIERGLFRVFLVLVCVHMLRAVAASRRARPAPPGVSSPAGVRPLVTVSVPIRNEGAVAERVIEAACGLRYPRDRLDIQVLDDSDDATSRAIIDAAVASVAARGAPIRVLRREDRRGFKAGNLANGLAHARGEYVAVLDADSRPPADFLERIVPRLEADPGLAMAQARWSYANEQDSWLTRAQALLLDGLMLVEQPAQAARGMPFQFNGAAGVWRAAALRDAGGWMSEAVAEDLDVSFRALARGWRFDQVPDLAVQTELPGSMGAFRQQQQRWLAGKVQVLRDRIGTVLTSPIPLRHRSAMLAHVLGRFISVFLAAMTITFPATALFHVPTLRPHSSSFDVAFFVGVITVVVTFYAASWRRAGRSLGATLAGMPALLTLVLGMSLCYSHALLRGLSKRRIDFVQTPRRGAPGAPPRVDATAWLELLVGAVHLTFASIAAGRSQLAFAAIFLWFGAAYVWVGGGALVGRWRAGRPRARQHERLGGRVMAFDE